MSNPVVDAFFLGRAFAEVLSEKVEEAYAKAVDEFGKFDAEQREYLRQFIEEVQTRAQKSSGNVTTSTTTTNTTTTSSNLRDPKVNEYNFNAVSSSADLQEMLDQLRAEIATLRSEIKKYRNQ